ncbi:MAG: hypothetical protein IT488_11430 [Gammaproteobacteria bacterium]|nr:hypothetical protein [Gammaproteobacteria bacterium]
MLRPIRIKALLKRAVHTRDWSASVQIGLSRALQVAIFMVFIGALWERHWLVAFTALVVLALTFLPALIEHQFSVHLPVEFTLVTSVFLYASFGLGEVRGYYQRYWWWDIMLHSLSALVMGLIGFLMVYVFYSTHRIRMAPLYVAITSFGFAVTVGTLWEIFEFVMDWFFGFNMQKSGLVDTMTDLMVDAVGALLAAILGYGYTRHGDAAFAAPLVRRFTAQNPAILPDDMRKKRPREDVR